MGKNRDFIDLFLHTYVICAGMRSRANFGRFRLPLQPRKTIRLRLRLRAKCPSSSVSGSGSGQNVMGKTGKTSFHDILLRTKCPSISVSGSGSGQNVPAPAAPAHEMQSRANLGRLQLRVHFQNKKLIPPPPPAPSIIFERHRLPTKCAGSSSASLPM